MRGSVTMFQECRVQVPGVPRQWLLQMPQVFWATLFRNEASNDFLHSYKS